MSLNSNKKESLMRKLVPTFGGIVLAVLLAFGPVQPAAGSWHAAQDWLPFTERFGSKKIDLPRASCGVRS